MALTREEVARISRQALAELLSMQRGTACLITLGDVAGHALRRWRVNLYAHLHRVREALDGVEEVALPDGRVWVRLRDNPWAGSRLSYAFVRADAARVRIPA